MTDREGIIAGLPRGARRVLHVIEAALGAKPCVAITRLDFEIDHHVNNKTVANALPLLSALGLVEVEADPRRARVFKLSRRWCGVSEADARAVVAAQRAKHPAMRGKVPRPDRAP